jgi:hypothetical protein
VGESQNQVGDFSFSIGKQEPQPLNLVGGFV